MQVQQYIVKKKEERKRKKSQERKAHKEAQAKKQKQLEELYRRQKKCAISKKKGLAEGKNETVFFCWVISVVCNVRPTKMCQF